MSCKRFTDVIEDFKVRIQLDAEVVGRNTSLQFSGLTWERKMGLFAHGSFKEGTKETLEESF